MNQKKTIATMLLTAITAITLLMAMTVTASAANDNGKKGEKGALDITFDGDTGQWTPLPLYHVKKGWNVTVRFININRLKYKIVIDGTLMNYNTDIPDIFSMLETPGKGDKTTPGGDAGAQKISFEDTVEKAEPDPAKKKKADAVIAGAKAEIAKAEAVIEKEMKEVKTQKDEKKAKTKAEIANAKAKIAKAEAEIAEAEAEINRLEAEAEINAAFEYLTNFIDDLNGIKKLIAQLQETLRAAKNFTQLELKEKQLFLTFIEASPSLSIKELQAEVVSACQKKFKEAGDGLQFINRRLAVPGSKISKAQCDKLLKFTQLMEEFKNKKYLEIMDKTLEKFSPKNFSFTKIFHDVDADGLLVEVDIKPIDEKEACPYQFERPLKVKVLNGWKIDFSTGVFFKINAHDHTYRLDESAAGDNLVILKENKEKRSVTPVFGALMHIYPRQLGSIKWSGISFGLSGGDINKFNYYLCTGIMFGSKERFILNAGVVLTKIDYLKPEFRDKLDKEMEKDDELAPGDLVKPTYRLRFFAGITYNLGKKE